MPYGPTDYNGAQSTWTSTIARWPLPVPKGHPFPETIPLHSLNVYDYYESTMAVRYAKFWWMCTASTAVVDARAAGDVELERYWIDALTWWGESQTRALTFGDSGESVAERTATTASSSDCLDLPAFAGVEIATPADDAG
jgi:hypothetical protein